METIKTKLHHYSFNTRKPEEAKAWSELQKQLLASVVHCMSAFGYPKEPHRLSTQPTVDEIELETRFAFSDQYNTLDGRRVFDWRLITPFPHDNQRIKRGHWIEQTEELRQMKRETFVCGYCGKRYGTWHPEHLPLSDAIGLGNGRLCCSACLGGEYLKEKELRLLTLRPIGENKSYNALPLTPEEEALLVPMYWGAQNRDGEKRTAGAITRAKQKAHTDYEEALVKAEQDKLDAAIKRDGKLWLLERNLKLDPIYYTHTKRFGFGWSSPLQKEDAERLLEVISEFPWPYDIKTTDRGTLSGER